jgi:hypothetical protein
MKSRHPAAGIVTPDTKAATFIWRKVDRHFRWPAPLRRRPVTLRQ